MIIEIKKDSNFFFNLFYFLLINFSGLFEDVT